MIRKYCLYKSQLKIVIYFGIKLFKNCVLLFKNDEPTIGHVKRDEDEHHAVTVISSLDDSFSLKQVCI